MRQVINAVDTMADDMLDGMVLSSCGRMARLPGIRAVVSAQCGRGRVQIISGGGSGYEPLYAGYIGKGMADALVLGNLYAAPSAYSIYETAKHMGGENGIVFVYGNYAGDLLNYDMASELLAQDGIASESIVVYDAYLSDCEHQDNRWGIAGIVWTIKIVGAAAALGHNFQTVLDIGRSAVRRLSTVSFLLEEENAGTVLHYGAGVSGEPGLIRGPLVPARQIAQRLYGWLQEALSLQSGDRACMMVNTYGATSYMENYILCKEMCQLLTQSGVQIHHCDVGNFYSSEGKGGCSVTVLKLDDQLETCFDVQADSFSYKKGGTAQ